MGSPRRTIHCTPPSKIASASRSSVSSASHRAEIGEGVEEGYLEHDTRGTRHRARSGRPFAPGGMSDGFADMTHAAVLNSPVGNGDGGDGGKGALHVNKRVGR
jgi:hypothetical protein